MRIRAGYNLTYECPQPTQMLLVLDIHPSRRVDLLSEQVIVFDHPVEPRGYIDGFGNSCTRIVAPAGSTTISTLFDIYDDGNPDIVDYTAVQHEVKDIPDDVLVFLLGNRSAIPTASGHAWARLGQTAPGSAWVQAVCDSCTIVSASDSQNTDTLRTAYGGSSNK